MILYSCKYDLIHMTYGLGSSNSGPEGRKRPFGTLCGPAQFSNYTGCAASDVTDLINCKYKMSVL
jgi:hypothetical protein